MNNFKVLFSGHRVTFLTFLAALMVVSTSHAQTCMTADDMDAATKSALTATAKNYFAMAARGDSASLKQSAIPSLAADFSSVETAVSDHKADFATAQANPRPPFLLKAEGTAPSARAEFLCGVFGANGQTADSAEFVIPNLPPGEYGIVILDVPTTKQPYTVSFVLQHEATAWKLGGFFVKETQVNGHDGNWFATQARAFKAKGQTHNAWLYFVQARDLISPVPFMYTLRTDKLYEEAQTLKPADFPVNGASADLVAAGKTYKLTAVFPLLVASDLDLVVKYESPSVSDTTKTFQDNMAVMKALVTKFPELRDAFAGIVARAVEPSGRDYGSLLTMKDIK
ncbi:MAG: hypothetical protein ACHP8A_06530 [Terriglobales bacterium]|jgi:hypothetical protein|nr:hypothetical protein [Terriglobales bacterium]